LEEEYLKLKLLVAELPLRDGFKENH